MIFCTFSLHSDQAAENCIRDAGEGEGAEEAGEGGHTEPEASSPPAVWFVYAGLAGMCRSLRDSAMKSAELKCSQKHPSEVHGGPCTQHETTGGSTCLSTSISASATIPSTNLIPLLNYKYT